MYPPGSEDRHRRRAARLAFGGRLLGHGARAPERRGADGRRDDGRRARRGERIYRGGVAAIAAPAGVVQAQADAGGDRAPRRERRARGGGIRRVARGPAVARRELRVRRAGAGQRARRSRRHDALARRGSGRRDRAHRVDGAPPGDGRLRRARAPGRGRHRSPRGRVQRRRDAVGDGVRPSLVRRGEPRRGVRAREVAGDCARGCVQADRRRPGSRGRGGF